MCKIVPQRCQKCRILPVQINYNFCLNTTIVLDPEQALDSFKKGNFEFGGSASAVIWDKGAGKAIPFENGAGVAIMPKAGAMVGISVGGQEFDYRSK